MDRRLISTTNEIAGYEISEHLGICRGVIVRSRSVVGNFGASLQSLVGGNITILSDLCEKTRAESYEIMIKHAEELGAEAIVGVRYESNEIAQGVAEILCYGTAVKIKDKR